MENLFISLQNKIAEELGYRVSLIDEDSGQLEALINGADQYPVTFPCVLISQIETEWESVKPTSQRGKSLINIRIAFDVYADTHYGSTQQYSIIERLALVKELNKIVHGSKFDGCASCMTRVRSKGMSMPGNIKVYESTYRTSVIEDF